MPEYGRHIQYMVDYLLTIQDKEKRQKNSEAVIELMGSLNPQLKIIEGFKHILWDHLFVISDYQLDIDSPYPKPTPATTNAKPQLIAYPQRNKKLRHLGKNVQTLIQKAINEKDEEKKEGLTEAVAYYMKLAYLNWHDEQLPDDMILNELKEITHGELEQEDGNIQMNLKLSNNSSGNHNNHYKKGRGKKSNNRSRGRSNYRSKRH